MKRLAFLAVGLIGLGACHDATSPDPSRREQAPDLSVKPHPRELIPGQYIIVFRDSVQDVQTTAAKVSSKHRVKLKRIYKAALKGMAVELSDSEVARLRSDPAIAYVEQNQVFRAIAEEVVQPNATFGLDRIDQRALPLSGTYSYTTAGTGVRVYIIDTGIKFDHQEFGGRAVLGLDAIGGDGVDCNGHGTHVAATVGGTTYGVAKQAQLIAVRVLNCGGSGTTFSVLDGIDWVTQHRIRPAVANMSLGGPASAAINQAVAGSISSGVTYVVAAGNNQADACNYSPSSVPEALTVAASDRNDGFATDFSNFGSCVDLVAPGKNITSAWIGSITATKIISGTSMASPHVAGTAALYHATYPDAQPATAHLALWGNATRDVLTGVPAGTQNRLVYTGFLSEASPWVFRTSLREARSAFALASANGRLYAIGGNAGSTALASVEEYDALNNSWSSKAPLPATRHDGNGAAAINGVLYLPGGRNAAGSLTRTLYAYNLANNSWSTRAALPTPSGCGASAVISGQLYVFTGCTAASAHTRLLHRYSPSTNRWVALASSPAPHGYPAVGVLGGKIYVAGGTNATGAATATLHVYIPGTNTWIRRAPMPSPRFGAAGRVINGKLYVVGGTSGTGELASMVVYDPATNTWTSREPMPTARRRLSTATIGDFLFAVGGRNGSTYLKTVERYTP